MDTRTLIGKLPIGFDDEPIAQTLWERTLEKLPYVLWGVTVLVIVVRWAMLLE
jgi:hypothetical protein